MFPPPKSEVYDGDWRGVTATIPAWAPPGNLPGLVRDCVRAVTCLYTVTPDFGFVVDAHPEFAGVIIASPCSGHGFKHSAALGEALAERIVGGRSALDDSLSQCLFS